jgi:hypothetical protein
VAPEVAPVATRWLRIPVPHIMEDREAVASSIECDYINIFSECSRVGDGPSAMDQGQRNGETARATKCPPRALAPGSSQAQGVAILQPEPPVMLSASSNSLTLSWQPSCVTGSVSARLAFACYYRMEHQLEYQQVCFTGCPDTCAS